MPTGGLARMEPNAKTSIAGHRLLLEAQVIERDRAGDSDAWSAESCGQLETEGTVEGGSIPLVE